MSIQEGRRRELVETDISWQRAALAATLQDHAAGLGEERVVATVSATGDAKKHASEPVDEQDVVKGYGLAVGVGLKHE